MAFINPGVLRKPLVIVFLFGTQLLYPQEVRQPIARFSHPALREVNTLVESQQYLKAISLSLKKAQQMKMENNWEGYMAFMLRAAEIETFEVWKTKSNPKTEIRPDYRRALTYLDSLYKYGEKYIDDYPYLKADALFTKAVVFDWLGRSDTAEQMHRTALNLRATLYGKDSREVADSYLWMGVLYRFNLNRKGLAKQYYQDALDLQKKYMPVSRYALGTIYYGLASIARENYEFDEAIAMANQYSSLYNDLPFEQGAAHQLIGNIYFDQKDFEKSLAQRKEAINIYEQSGFNDELILTYSNLASDLEGNNRYDEAMQTLRKALKILDRYEDFLYEKNIYENLGNIYRIVGRYDSAEYCFNKSFQIAINRFGKKNQEVADVYELRGKLFIEQGKFADGLNDYQQMLAAVINDFQPADIYDVPKAQKESPNFVTIITAQFNKGDALVKWYNKEKNPLYLERALNQYKAAYVQLMEGRKTIGDELSKPFLMLNFQNSVESSIYCAKRLYELTKEKHYYQDIFRFVELTKYLNVLDALQRAERANNSTVPKALIFQLQDVRNELNNLQQKLLRSAGDSIGQLNDKILSLMSLRRELMNEISKYPDYASTNLDSMLLDVNEIQRKLTSEDQILEYFWGTDSIYVLSMTGESATVSSIAYVPEMDSQVSSVYRHMSGIEVSTKESINKFSQLSSTIYKTFFDPFIQKNRLIIIPDGPLSIVSVDALVFDHEEEVNTYSSLDYLIFHNEISYAYSASILFKERSFKSEKIENVLAFSYSNGSAGPTFAWRNQRGELPGTYKELEALSRLFKNVRRFTDINATKLNFINNTDGNDIIHLGVHGIGDEEVADNSRLIFKGDSLDDAELYAYEIYNLNLSAGLVVLSACESGVGRNQKGEGMFSIARAFTYAGCPAAVMSLWQARDIFTSEIMVQFYENLKNKEPVNHSLREAKLQFLRESDSYRAHPANWAAFVLNGQDIEFAKEPGKQIWVYILLALMVFSGITIFLRRKMITGLR